MTNTLFFIPRASALLHTCCHQCLSLHRFVASTLTLLAMRRSSRSCSCSRAAAKVAEERCEHRRVLLIFHRVLWVRPWVKGVSVSHDTETNEDTTDIEQRVVKFASIHHVT